MAKTTLTLSFLLLFVVSTVHAKTAKELSDACTSKDSFMNGYCFGYMEGLLLESGLFDPEHPVLTFLEDRDQIRMRMTGNYTLGQFERAYVAYLAAHPEYESNPPSSVMFLAWEDHKMIRLAKRGEQ